MQRMSAYMPARRCRSTGSSRPAFARGSASSSSSRLASPRCRRATPARSKLNVVMATDQPAWSGPSMAERGTRASVKKSSAKVCPPVMVVSGRASTPGVRRSTRKHVMPACFFAVGSVRTYSWHQSAKCPSEFQVFCPLSTKSSPSSTASRAQRGQVRAGVGLGHALGPDLVAAQHGLQEALLLFGRAELHDGRRDVRDADHVDRPRRPHPVGLLQVGQLLGDAGPAPAVLDRPRRCRPPAVGQRPVPGPQHLEGAALALVAARPADHLGREVDRQPGPQLGPEGAKSRSPAGSPHGDPVFSRGRRMQGSPRFGWFASGT